MKDYILVREMMFQMVHINPNVVEEQRDLEHRRLSSCHKLWNWSSGGRRRKHRRKRRKRGNLRINDQIIDNKYNSKFLFPNTSYLPFHRCWQSQHLFNWQSRQAFQQGCQFTNLHFKTYIPINHRSWWMWESNQKYRRQHYRFLGLWVMSKCEETYPEE